MPRPSRVFLRAPSRRDLREFTALLAKCRAFLAPWASTSPGKRTVAATPRAILEASIASNRSGRSLRRFVCRAEDGAILGTLNVNEIVLGSFRSGYLGYWIGPEHARCGHMTEALALLLREAFEDLGLHRLEANVVPGNRASIALVRRAGFRREGLSPRYLHIAGRWRDHERWALTVEDWEAARGPVTARGRRPPRAG